ncbi:low-specificity L-threonine aldolase [Desulfopila aestuarii]|uniref:L-threonine aldolase n=1 Tax=Desulfopila aestuarii DSM 18488 TaxID=1121416 RepID=A0A1M7Y548_9BACT|nr:low-specificity L-threonine aldolase [Desulfopila aestuarii]SHO47444.1 L-threonine aldolase [Desulfopila aestuarii DSM 18488]
MHLIDLRSDTVTRPTTAMREAMMMAEVGDDVYGDDPTVNTLQEFTANLLGFEAALFTCSGTQANFVALMAHCQRGDEYIVGQQAHTYRYEGGGAAVLGSIQPQPIEFTEDGTLDLDLVASKIKPDDIHFARTRLLCLENTQNGRFLPLEYLRQARDFSRSHSLKLHLDGARVFNAAVAQDIHVSEIAHHFDSVSVCLSKGLGAPIGSVLCGSTDFITRARRWRKVAGGGMRQAGILAAAGLFSLNHNVQRLAEDHANAHLLARGLQDLPQLTVRYEDNQTNMVFVTVADEDVTGLTERLRTENIIVSPGTQMRLVTHLDITTEDVESVIDVFHDHFR